ncbi:MAG: type III PLP-dependent enzyme [Steroidobacteraceae bacterium]|nr:type III PLP-dependent enzyme [Steroidobacteraceae bacterium]
MNTNLRLPSPYTPAALSALVGKFGSPLFVIDCDVIRRQYRALAEALPGVDLHYALKPLPDRTVVKVLAREGSWFDLATNGEVDLVRKAGIPPERCIHTHPIKRDADIRHTLDYGVTTFVVDNPDEVDKFVAYRDRVQLLLRLSFRSPEAVVDLSRKFGCDTDAALELARRAARARIRVAGLSFHVGSQVARPDMYVQAIETCAGLIAEGRRGLGPFEILDIGGGFPIDYLEPVAPIAEFCAPIRAALARLPEKIRVIAEPGRFICGPAAIGLATVMGRAKRDGRWWYYLDDGLYGTFSGQLYDHSRFPVEPVLPHGGERQHCVVAGPTCDSIDVVSEDIMLPELEIGDLVVARQIGAYTIATATDFNFFPRARVLAVNVARGG